jgi:uncharacterized pyridoxamine 5'-phosphate oxidase family protein
MGPKSIIAFLRKHQLAVQASVSADGAPQAAVVGFAVSEAFEIIFDMLESHRKFRNLRQNPRIALVIGWDDEKTVQLEGTVDFPTGAELARIRDVYFGPYPDGRDRLACPGITHARVRPTWVRFSDFTTNPPSIVELSGEALQLSK